MSKIEPISQIFLLLHLLTIGDTNLSSKSGPSIAASLIAYGLLSVDI